ncbi:MAG: glutamine synthetase family protein [Lachnospiraceae bacterium]|nr:glutamine synthetase family protein [Lachnospiraceae bacterium]
MSNYTVEEVMEFVEDNDVKFIRLAFCDIFGNQKNISIMPQQLREAFDMGMHFDSFLILGYDDPVYQDLFLKPDPGTLSVLPWRPQQGRVIRFYCDVVTPDGVPYPYDARKFLQDTLQECADLGFSCRIGLKSEFYLFKTDEEGRPTDEPWDQGGYMDISPLDRGENIRREICLCLEEMGIQPKESHHEAGPGQNEIDFKTSDALGTADNYITYKNVVGAIAARNGVYASFAPKPIKGKSGNGLHMKVSTWRNGVNIDDVDPQFTANFMAGVLHRMKDITVFLNTQAESYERFGENEAPKYINWSAQNRSRLLRVPIVNGKKTCFVLRSPDSGINPYLAFAMVIQAGLAGIRGKETLPPPLDIDSRHASEEQKEKYEKLPLSLAEAVDIAKKSQFLQNGKCKDMANHFIEVVEKNRL